MPWTIDLHVVAIVLLIVLAALGLSSAAWSVVFVRRTFARSQDALFGRAMAVLAGFALIPAAHFGVLMLSHPIGFAVLVLAGAALVRRRR